jgi:hypothetical protein
MIRHLSLREEENITNEVPIKIGKTTKLVSLSKIPTYRNEKI